MTTFPGTSVAPDGEYVRLRPLRRSDLGRVAELEPALFEGEAWSPATYEDELAHPARRYLAAVLHRPGAGERLVGWAGVSLGVDAEIMTVGVDEAYQRRGIARRMLRSVIAELSRRGCERVLLEVRDTNTAARALYASEGFHDVSIRRGYYRSSGADAVVMARTLHVDADGPRRASALVSARMLAAELAGATPPAVLDVRWTPEHPDGHTEFEAAHVPGAAYVDLDADLAAPPDAVTGRHPLPDPVALEAAVRSWGIDEGRPVVVMDDLFGVPASRAWWLLRWAGLADVRVLDGGLRAWCDEGLPLESGPTAPRRGDAVLPLARGGAAGMPVTDIEEVPELAEEGRLLDVRDEARYRGEGDPWAPRTGHVPGAINAPLTGVLTPEGRFASPSDLRAHFTRVGLNPDRPDHRWTIHCGTGVTAPHTVLALASLGSRVRLWPGSWSQWTLDEGRPVATGDDDRG